jgi:hypothetical protein
MSLPQRWQSIKLTLPATSSSSRRASLPQNGERAARLAVAAGSVFVAALLVGSCLPHGDAPAVVKIGVIAPFEGVGRRLGYAVLPEIKGELASANRQRPKAPYRVALVALNDDLDAREAAEQARALVQDPDVLAVIGLWSDETSRSAAPILAEAGVPILLVVPHEGSSPGLISICPTPDEVAAELLRSVAESGRGRVVISGPDTALRRALSARESGLPVVPEASSSPCEGEGLDCRVVYSGDALGAANMLRRWRDSGWRGDLFGGPETARPWLPEQARGAAEGTRAVVCGNLGSSLSDQDASLENAAASASAATRTILDSLERVVEEQGVPSRRTITEHLVAVPNAPGLTWLVVRDGRWVRLHE